MSQAFGTDSMILTELLEVIMGDEGNRGKLSHLIKRLKISPSDAKILEKIVNMYQGDMQQFAEMMISSDKMRLLRPSGRAHSVLN